MVKLLPPPLTCSVAINSGAKMYASDTVVPGYIPYW